MSKNIAELIAQVIVKDTNSSLADQKRIIEFQEKEGNAESCIRAECKVA